MSDPTLAQDFGCSPAITCPGSDNPIMNISAEAPDEPIFIGLNWGPVQPPPVLNHYSATGCLGECDSTVGQQDADLCAARQSLQCVNSVPNTPPGTPPRFTIICNTPQTATVTCPDGLPFSYTVGAGLFCGSSQTLVNQQALAYATQLANEVRLCMGNAQRCTCVGQAYSSTINLGGSGSSGAVWSIIFGILPPGLALSQTGVISGVPNTPGTYNFEVMAKTSIGTFMQKPMQITVLSILTSSLPNFTPGIPYSYQLLAAGGSGSYAWKVVSGTLPPGITLSLTGLLSGTPTGTGVNPLTFSVIDTTCEALDKTYFPPAIALATTSTTQVATVRGFPEYAGFVSSPPKRYHNLTWQGSSEQQLWMPPSTAPAYNYVLLDIYGSDRYTGSGQAYQSQTSGYTVSVSGTGITEGHWIFLGPLTPQGIPVLYVGPSSAGGAGPAGAYTNCDLLGLCPPNGNPPTINVTGPFTQPPVTTPAQQVAGARFDYSGTSSIDGQGNYSTLYSKNLSEMCSAADNLVATFLPVGTANVPYIFAGWIGPTGHNKCALPGTPYSPVGNEAIGKGDAAINDSSNFWGSKAVGNGRQISNFNVINATQGSCVDSGGDQSTPVFTALFEPVGQNVTPPVNGGNQGSLWFGAAVVWNHSYSSLLDTEYTDAEALANAQVSHGNGAVAQNQPRTTGFVSTFTSVKFTLTAFNLLTGTSYTVSVDFADIIGGTITTRTYAISGSSASQTITDNVPTPLPGHLVQVRNPRITFS